DGVFQKYRNLRIAMMGDFQYENAALAVVSLDVLAGHGEINLSEAQVAAGLPIEVPGRFEVVQTDPMVILDGAHNLPKATALANSLKHAFPGRKMSVVLGTLTIKDFSGIIEVLAPLVHRWVVTEPKVFGKPAAPTSALVKQIHAVTPELEVLEAPDVQDAIDLALEHEGKDGLVLVTGSLYLLGAARSRWVNPQDILRKLEAAYQSKSV
ncbi:MAG: glutamate ligase domain-containing protein, partial [Anaerolineales bacterium]